MTRHYYEGRNGQSKIKYVNPNWNTLFNLAQDYWEVSPAEYLDLHSDIKNVLRENWNVNTAKCDELAEKYLKTQDDDDYDNFANSFWPYPMNQKTREYLVDWNADRHGKYVITLEDYELDFANEHDLLPDEMAHAYEINDRDYIRDIKAAYAKAHK